MKIDCVSCGRDINLDHPIFVNYVGPLKCFSCGTMMKVEISKGLALSIRPLFFIDRRFPAIKIERDHPMASLERKV
jgi:hypothetical protein